MRYPTIIALAAITVLSAASLLARPAAAMPVSNLATSASGLSDTQNVAWVCGPYRCWWAPRRYYYAPVVVAPRIYYGYAPVYGYGYGPYYGYRVVRPGWYGYRRGLYRRGWR